MIVAKGAALLAGMVLVLFIPPNAPAETALPEHPFPYTFSFGVLTGFLYGQAEEIVYNDDSDEKVSQLLWDMKPLAYAGLALNVSRRNPLEKWGFFGDFTFKFGLPGFTGIMEDRDWQPEDGHLTNFSAHNNYTQKAFLADASLGVSFPLFSRVLLKSYLDYSFMYFSWASSGGYLKYEKYLDYDPWEKVPVSGPAIDYEQQWGSLSLGTGLWIPFARFFSADVDFQIGFPLSCEARDEHLERKIQFNDSMSGGLFLEPKAVFSFSPLSILEITLSGGWRYISGSRGSTEAVFKGQDGRSEYYENAAGAGYSVWDTGISVKLRF